MFKLKRGQITIFMIIGVLLVFSSGLVFFIRTSNTEDRFASQIQSQASKVPLDILPVKEYVDTCLRQVGIGALKYVGSHGGYYNYSMFKTDLRNLDSEMVNTSFDKIPFWYFISNCDKVYGCGDTNQIPLKSVDPAVPSLEGELEKYIDDNLDSCLNNFLALQNNFDVKKTRDIKTDVIIRERDVYFKLDMPLKVTNRAGNSVEVQTFVQSVGVNLLSIYNFANDLIQKQYETGFLEKMLFDVMSLYMDENIPPVDGLDTESPRYWKVNEVREFLDRDIFPFFVPIIQFQGTMIKSSINANPYNEQFVNDLSFGFFSALTKKRVSEENYDSLSVEFEYVSDKLFLELNKGQFLIGPQDMMAALPDMNPMILFMNALNRYHTSYDFTLPVTLTLTDFGADYHAFGDEGYSFRIALELNMRNNEPYIDSVELDFPHVSAQQKIDLTKLPELYPNRTFSIAVVDAWTEELIPDAQINYICNEKRYIGDTNEQGLLVTKLPQCLIGGRFEVLKSGYSSEFYDFSNNDDKQSGVLGIKLWPIKQINVTVQKLKVNEFVVGNTPVDVAMKTLSLGIAKFFEEDQTVFDHTLDVVEPKTDLLDVRLSDLRANNMAFGFVKSVGTSALNFVFPGVGTLVNVLYTGATFALKEATGFEFPVNDSQYISLVQDMDLYKTTVEELDSTVNDSIILELSPLSEQTRRVPMLGNYFLQNGKNWEVIDLVPGTYDINTMLMHNAEFQMNIMSFCDKNKLYEMICENFLDRELMEPINMSNYPKGSFQTVFEIEPEDLYNNDNLHVMVVDQGIPKNSEDFKDNGYEQRASRAVGDFIEWS